VKARAKKIKGNKQRVKYATREDESREMFFRKSFLNNEEKYDQCNIQSSMRSPAICTFGRRSEYLSLIILGAELIIQNELAKRFFLKSFSNSTI